MNIAPNSFKWINLFNHKGKEYLKLTFSGTISKLECKEACEEWKRASDLNPEKKYHILINALKMEDYEPMARITFQNTVKELKNKIEKIWLVTDSKLISTGASVISLFTSLSIKSVHSEDEVFL